ncbi:MAG: hypothetical protein B6245_21565 [Desulfobacteraceae bacterium 4572_88]|nr:MAG: hypothetical protein B6245_21565 [Desulfobacteraceae bacterium 4572_88]
MKNKPIFILLIIVYLALFCAVEKNTELSAAVSGQETYESLFAKGESFYQKGDFEHAAQSWEQAIKGLDMEKDREKYLDTLIRLSNAYQSLGYHKRALSAFEAAFPAVEASQDYYRNALFFSALGDLHLSLGNAVKAYEYLEKGVAAAELSGDSRVQATVLNNLGNVYVTDEDYQGAVDIYDECLLAIAEARQADAPDLSELKSKALINMVFVLSHTGSGEDIAKALAEALQHLGNLPNTHQKASDMISLSMLVSELRTLNRDTADQKALGHQRLISTSYDLLKQAEEIAKKLEDTRTLSYTYGQMGQLYEAEEQYADAMKLTRRAIFFAEQGKYSEILYRWQWQLARLLRTTGDTEKAIRVYHDAIATLNPIRQELFKGYRSRKDTFNENIKPVYLELADLLLENAGDSKTSRRLYEARDVMEVLKTAELQDFFEDECVTAMQRKVTRLDRTEPHTAVLYPIPLPDKLALLLTLPDGMRQVKVPVEAEKLRETTLRFRARLQTRPNNRYLHDAWQLYDWLIRPIEDLLTAQKIETLIIAPDGALRLIPFSTLNDGEHFLVEKYAIGTIPGITLTDPRPLDSENINILVAGLSKGVQDFSPLPSVTKELADIKTIMGAKVVLQDDAYTIENLTNEFKNNEYNIVHLATHGIFSSSQEESFLLTYEDKLTMDRLERLIGLNRFRDQQVELLTMSACQTAKGDERAALGLAGVALKAGVRGAIATLWYVDDEATALVIREFYQQLRMPGISKARALQNAQKKLVSQRRYQHPGYWAPFLLIGNWL